MDGKRRAELDNEHLASRIFDRLQQDAPGYDWDTSLPPFHSSYDNWHVWGTTRSSPLPKDASQPVTKSRPHSFSQRSSSGSVDTVSRDHGGQKVVARISRHALRLEREYKLAVKLSGDPNGKDKFIQPIDFLRLPPRQATDVKLVVMVVLSPGRNYLIDMVELGPNSYQAPSALEVATPSRQPSHQKMPLQIFMAFATGAVDCLVQLHFVNELVHGDLRADAFHYNKETGNVRLINFGGGARSFENGLTSAGWSTLTSQLGVEHKLQFVAPEQTGRMPAEPDSRTDIYSLGVLFWMMLADEVPFSGDGPLEIMQGVLNRRIPPIDTKRPDIPVLLSRIIQKMTQKNMTGRYQSSAGLRHDLLECQRLFEAGDSAAIEDFKLSSKDISSSFRHPPRIIGRSKQLEVIKRVVERASTAAQQRSAMAKQGLTLLRTTLAANGDQPDSGNFDSLGSDSTSSASRGRESRLASVSDTNGPESFRRQHEHGRDSIEQVVLGSTLDTRDSNSSMEGASLLQGAPATSKDSLLRTAQKLRRSGRCEVITISGSAGMGKSVLLQTVQTRLREYGYYASAKFDQVKRVPFEPAFRVMSSLFRQIFSASDVGTDLHQQLRVLVRPVWGALHNALELPPWLLSQDLHDAAKTGNNAEEHPSDASKRCGEKGNTAADWLHSGGIIRDRRFVNIFMDFLRLLSMHKFLCICLDDLQFADDESLDLIHSIISSGVPIVLITTFRAEDEIDPKVQSVVSKATKIDLSAFTEEQTSEYITGTMHRQASELVPLTAVVHQRSSGIPFLVREVLDQLYRAKAVFYSWRESQWDYDIDKSFQVLASAEGTGADPSNYLAKRLQKLPQEAKTLLCWASLIGNSFHFSLLNRVMSCDCSHSSPAELLPTRVDDAVAGLQGALASFAIMATEEEDRFRFSHDRYLGAARSLREQFVEEEMHFVIASAMIKHDPWAHGRPTQILFDQSQHICSAIEVVRKRAKSYKPFRQLLYEASQVAQDQGARQISLFFLEHAMKLLDDDPWRTEHAPADTTSNEVLTLVTQIAGANWYLGQSAEASKAIDQIFEHAPDPVDRSAAYVIQSRIFTQQGDSPKALEAMTQAMTDLGYSLELTTWEQCDAEFRRLAPILAYAEPDLSPENLTVDTALGTTGAVLVELLSVAFWTDDLLFFQLSLKMLNIYLENGLFPQLALGYVHVGSIAIGRFDMVEYGLALGRTARKIMNAFAWESYTNGRGLTLYSLFLGHLDGEVRDQLPVLQQGLDSTIAAGDRILQTLNIGVQAAYRLWSSHDLGNVEAYVLEQTAAIPGWREDMRGGVLLNAVLRYSQALQGKTYFRSAKDVMSTEQDSAAEYRGSIIRTASQPMRPLTLFDCYRFVILYRFGHHREALELGHQLLESVDALFSMPYTYFTLAYYSYCLLEEARRNPESELNGKHISSARAIERKLSIVGQGSDSHLGIYVHILRAELAEVDGMYQESIAEYEAAVNHADLHNVALAEGFACEMYAEWCIRRNSTRPGRSLINDAIAAYRSVGALGKIQHIMEKHAFTIHRTRSTAYADQATQTSDNFPANNPYKLARHEDDMGSQISEERTKAWLAPVHAPAPSQDLKDSSLKDHSELSAAGLDMIDLATLLQSSQLLSSELDMDKLLSKLNTIIVDTTGAEAGGVVILNEEVGWQLAVTLPINKDLHGQAVEDLPESIPKQTTLYCLRFRETLFIPNVFNDERFAISEEDRQQSPEGRAIIAIPILHGEDILLGSIYIEGPARSFTERNTAVLRLLVNQVSISIANALLFKRLEKANASNAAMLEVQKKALENAREAERKAKEAEAQAMENVRLKEEASKAKSMFLANVSHELRTPLNGVIGMSELLKASTLSKEQESYADSIRVCADTLLSVINDILDFSKLEAGKMQMFNVQLSLKETISEVVRALSYTNYERGLQTDEELEIDSDLLIMGDPVRLHQVFMNLLSNAYKFTAKGRVVVKAVVEKETDTMIQVTCSVTDTGIGVSEEQKKKLFLPFSQADSSTARSYGGTGLGLSICKAIIEIMKGQIWLDSKPGVGTTVAFTIPFQKIMRNPGGVNGQAAGSNDAAHQRGADPMSIYRASSQEDDPDGPNKTTYRSLMDIPRDQLRICIAEDNPINQKIAISFVEKLGLKCEAFFDGQQAVDALASASAAGKPFHLVLMDCQMPVLDGYGATREIRAHPDPMVRDVLIIAMTASAIRGDREKCLEAGMNNYLAKPVRAAVLKSMINAYLAADDAVVPDLQGVADGIARAAIAETATQQQRQAKESAAESEPRRVHDDEEKKEPVVAVNSIDDGGDDDDNVKEESTK